MELESSNLNRNLLKELIELRQIKNERESILRTNQYYIAQVSQMEIKISELKASLQAKESEISYLTHKITEFEERAEASPNSHKNLEDQIVLLQAENEHLKIQLLEAGEISQLKIQLEYALKMKETFEEKYREAKTLLLTKKNTGNSEGFNEGDYTKREAFSKIQEELENTKRQLLQFQSQCSILSAENEELIRKIDMFERESVSGREKIDVPASRQKAVLKSISSLEPTRNLVSSSSTNSSEPCKPPAKSPDNLGKSSSYANIPKISKLNNSRVVKSSLLPTQKMVAKNEVVEYCPSFMRSKKSDFKATPTPSVKKNSLNSFADEFPEEEEF